MREIVGWACAVPLAVTVVAGVVLGILDAIKDGEGVGVIVAAGAWWGLA